ncbi:MAG: tetratricopeptide repeat protein, partial [bacterium]|nr:tetratricopeptide repeat protein [bacterium]
IRKLESQKIMATEQVKIQHYNNGMDYFEKDDYDGAIKEMEAVLKLDPGHKQAREYLQRSLAAKKNPMTYSKEIMDLYYQGIDFYVAGDYKKAIDVWNRILKLDPYNNLALKNIADAEKKLKELERLKKTK